MLKAIPRLLILAACVTPVFLAGCGGGLRGLLGNPDGAVPQAGRGNTPAPAEVPTTDASGFPLFPTPEVVATLKSRGASLLSGTTAFGDDYIDKAQDRGIVDGTNYIDILAKTTCGEWPGCATGSKPSC